MRWLQPLCALLGALLLALAVDLLVNWQRGPSDEREVTLRRIHCTIYSSHPPHNRPVPEKDGKWCFATKGRDIAINIPILGRSEGYEMQLADIPTTQILRPVPLGETVNVRWRSYRSIFGVANAYYQVTDIYCLRLGGLKPPALAGSFSMDMARL